MVHDEMTQEEAGGGISTGAIVATAVATGVIAFLIRRSRQQEPEPVRISVKAARALEDSADDLRSRTATATREFVIERVLPEVKPIILDLVRDVKNYVDDGFKRLEKSINAL